ncbi:MAG: hypothetical protein EZS28_050689, partial [Streblomastix strix]
MKLSLLNELRNRDPSNVVDEFGDEEEDEALVKVQESELKAEIHIYDQQEQPEMKEKENKKQKKKEKKEKTDFNYENNPKLALIEQQDEEEKQKDNKERQQEESDAEEDDDDNNKQNKNGDADMMDEELEYDEQKYVKKYKLIQQKKMENSLISYIYKIKDKADDILAPIVQQFLYDPDAVIQKVMGDYTFEYIMLFQKYGWRFFDDDEDEEEEDEDLFENNKCMKMNQI